MDFPTAHALLRDRRDWRGLVTGLAPVAGGADDGDLELARVPGPSGGKPVVIEGVLPYTREVSGIATGPCSALFIADTAHDRVLYVDGLCGAQAWLPPRPGQWTDAPGQFRAPRGLACAADALLVADSGNARVQRLSFPRLEAHMAWASWVQPVALAVDSKQRVLLVDAATATLRRVRADGTFDTAFDAAVAATGELAQPLFVAVDGEDRVFVSDALSNELVAFDAAGAFAGKLPGPPGWLPGAIATFGTRAYAADAASGAIWVFEGQAGAAQCIGQVAGWQGPVTALATDDSGALYIKPGLDAAYHRFAADAAYLPLGTLVAGPLDAGEDREWERAWADAQVPAGCSVQFEIAVGVADAPPAATDWITMPSADGLLALLAPPGRRFGWLRLTLASASTAVTPRLRQARLATAAEDYLDYLPQTYRYQDNGADGFLSRWLRLMRSEFGRVEEVLDDMPRVADPRFGAPDSMAWLAQWFGLELPRIADDGERRALITRAVQLLARRGTRQSIAEFVELHTGIAPVIVEAFTDRRIWVLGESSRLDFDTRLAPLDPLGMVVPEMGSSLPIGRAVVGESGPLAEYQIGLPLYAEEAYRFCVVVDAYRAHEPQTRQEIARIVEREKPAHTDYRIELVHPDMRVGFQARIGIDAIVGGEPPPLKLGASLLSTTSNLPPSDLARVGEAVLDGSLTLI